MFQSSLIAKPVAFVSLLAASYLSPFSWQPNARTCTGPNCPLQQRQCSHPATVVINSIPVTTAPQLFNSDLLGDQWVLVEEPIHEGEPEDLVSPVAETEEVKAEIEADASEPAEDQAAESKAAEDQPEAKTTARPGDDATAKRTTQTRKVWMRASDARSAGLLPTASSGGGGGFGSSGSGIAMATPVAYEQVTYRQSYGCTGGGMSAFYGQPVYYQHNTAGDCGGCSAVGYYPSTAQTYRTRRMIFPNLFPRLRGLR